MATMNPFDLLGDDDNDDLEQLVQKIVVAPAGKPTTQPPKPSAKLPSKPLPPAQAVREARNEGARGGCAYGRGGFNRDSDNNRGLYINHGISNGQNGIEEPACKSSLRRGGGYGGSRGGSRSDRHVTFVNGDGIEDGERPRRAYERRSGTGRGDQEEMVEKEKAMASDKPDPVEVAADKKNENSANERVEEPEKEEMTLEEYQKVLEEKRKALEALKTEERKVKVDKDLASMQQLSNKKASDEFFVKLGPDKDKRKDITDREERAKKSLSINEFLKPAEGESYYTPGRRGRGTRGGDCFSQGGGSSYAHEAPKIEDPSHFPTLAGK